MTTSRTRIPSLAVLLLTGVLVLPATAQTTPERIVCTQAGVPIITVENVDGVTVDKTGVWPIMNFRIGPAGPARAVGLSSPTLTCMSSLGAVQGELYQPNGSTGTADIQTLTCFRKGKVIHRREVLNLNISWAGPKMALSYRLRGEEAPTSFTFTVTDTACLAEPPGEELAPAR